MARPSVWFVLGAVMVACFGAPLAGAITGLFTKQVAGGSTESAAVARIEAAIYIRHHEEGDYPAAYGMPLGSLCEQHMRGHELDAAGNIDMGVINLNSAIRREQARRKHNVADWVGRTALMKLPDTVLGALQGCIAGSLLAPFYENLVHHVEQAARQTASVAIARDEAASDSEMEQAWCAADRTFAPGKK